LFITSDEEIKGGDWFYSVRELIEKAVINYPKGEHFGKIILTTDADLIADGVQAIDDEFLKWFIKNPSCESVKVMFACRGFNGVIPNLSPIGEYKIIIPKEEPKQGTMSEAIKQVISNQLKQETLEEFIESYVNRIDRSEDGLVEKCLEDGVKWQQERSYSEEEVKKIINDIVEKHCTYFEQKIKDDIKLEWFEQFKNK
jgi:Glu-tRNA(Gln) amidotransferase subunit E-like FAD-binding protein